MTPLLSSPDSRLFQIWWHIHHRQWWVKCHRIHPIDCPSPLLAALTVGCCCVGEESRIPQTTAVFIVGGVTDNIWPLHRPRPWGLDPDVDATWDIGSVYGYSLFMTDSASGICQEVNSGTLPCLCVSASLTRVLTSHRPYKAEAQRHGWEFPTVISLTPKNIAILINN